MSFRACTGTIVRFTDGVTRLLTDDEIIESIGDGSIDVRNEGGGILLNTIRRTDSSYLTQFHLVDLLLKGGADPNLADLGGCTPLIYVSRSGNVRLAKSLLVYGANLDTRDYNGTTPLMIAAIQGHSSIVRLLAENGAEIDAVNDYGHTALMDVCWRRDASMDVISYLLSAGANPNFRCGMGRTLLTIMCASQYNCRDRVELLLTHGVDVNSVSETGETALAKSSQKGDVSSTKLLLDSGAHRDVSDDNGDTPLSLSKTHQIKRLLLKPRGN